VHLLLRIINLNLQIVVLTSPHEQSASDGDENVVRSDNDDDDLDKLLSKTSAEKRPLSIPSISQEQKSETVNTDNIKTETKDLKEIKMETLDYEEENIRKAHQESHMIKNDSVNLSNLKEIINRVRSQPSKVNAACAYFLNDVSNSITSSVMSPNFEIVSYTSESSSIYLYKLNEEFGMKTGTENSHQSKVIDQSNYCMELVGGHTGAVFKSKFTHDSKYLLTCGEDGVACLWNLKQSGMLVVIKLAQKQDF
jgi:WD40 repeat protein